MNLQLRCYGIARINNISKWSDWLAKCCDVPSEYLKSEHCWERHVI